MRISKATTIFLGMMMLMSSVPTSAHAATTLTTYSLPSGSLPIGLVYSNGFVYTVSYTYGYFLKIDARTGANTILAQSSGQFNNFYYGLALDNSSGNFWVTRRFSGDNGNPEGVTVISSTGRVSEILNVTSNPGEMDGIGIVNGFAYTAVSSTLYRIELAPPYHAQMYTISGGGGAYGGMVGDTSGNVWFSDIVNGNLWKFSPNNGTLSAFAGFHRPLGLAIHGSTISVAENCRSSDTCLPAIAQMAISGGAITRARVTGSPWGISAINGGLIWTSSGEDSAHTTTVCVLNGQCVSTGQTNFFISNDNAGNTYVSFYGGKIGKMSGLTPLPVSTSCCEAGYVGGISSGTLTMIHGQWFVPPVICQPSLGVEQAVTIYEGLSNATGTNIEAVRLTIVCPNGSSSPSYTLQAILPSIPNFVNLTLTVNPGDLLSVSIMASSTEPKVAVAVSDLTTRLNASLLGTANQLDVNAVWTVQLSNGTGLAKFTAPINFIGCSITSSGVTIPMSELNLLQRTWMTTGSNNLLAKVSPLSGTGMAFSVAWVKSE